MYVRRKPSANAGRLVKLAAIWSVITVSVCGLGAAAVMIATSPPDPYSLCQRSAIEAAAATTVIVDPTDTLT